MVTSLIGSRTLVKGLDDPRAYRPSKGWKQGLIRLFKVETEHTFLPMVQNEAVLSTNSGNGTPVTSLMILHTRPPSLTLKRLQRANGRRESCQQQVLMICCMALDPTPFLFLLTSTTRSKPTDSPMPISFCTNRRQVVSPTCRIQRPNSSESTYIE